MTLQFGDIDLCKSLLMTFFFTSKFNQNKFLEGIIRASPNWKAVSKMKDL